MGGQCGKPYLAGRICSDMRAMLNAVLIGGMPPERMYTQIYESDKAITDYKSIANSMSWEL